MRRVMIVNNNKKGVFLCHVHLITPDTSDRGQRFGLQMFIAIEKANIYYENSHK